MDPTRYFSSQSHTQVCPAALREVLLGLLRAGKREDATPEDVTCGHLKSKVLPTIRRLLQEVRLHRLVTLRAMSLAVRQKPSVPKTPRPVQCCHTGKAFSFARDYFRGETTRSPSDGFAVAAARLCVFRCRASVNPPAGRVILCCFCAHRKSCLRGMTQITHLTLKRPGINMLITFP